MKLYRGRTTVHLVGYSLNSRVDYHALLLIIFFLPLIKLTYRSNVLHNITITRMTTVLFTLNLYQRQLTHDCKY